MLDLVGYLKDRFSHDEAQIEQEAISVITVRPVIPLRNHAYAIYYYFSAVKIIIFRCKIVIFFLFLLKIHPIITTVRRF